MERERAAAEEEASRSILRSVRKALTEGLLALPSADYQWLEVAEPRRTTAAGASGTATSAPDGGGDTPPIDLADTEGSLAAEPGGTAPDAEADASEPVSAALPRRLAELEGVSAEDLVRAALECRDEADFLRLAGDRSATHGS